MKIAVSSENGLVFQHFGKTKTFTIYEIEDKRIKNKSVVDTGGQGHSALVGFLSNLQVNILICGGIGQGAKEALEKSGIVLMSGALGTVDQAVEDYLAGKMIFNLGETCNHHDGEHSCNSHSS